ncbi:MAG: DUF5916 domain-containing protein [Verrucomicrobiota bacterium]
MKVLLSVCWVSLPWICGAQVSGNLPLFEEAPVVDGVLDDSAWQSAFVIEDLYQVFPDEGEPATYPARLRVGYDAGNVYFATEVRMPGNLITANQQLRDGDQSGDDSISLIIDPHGQGREGYRFRFNPLGAREDAIIEDVFRVNTDWDGVWSVETQITETGWVAEGVIPLRSISFNPSIETWGFNIEQQYARRAEKARWSAIHRTTAAESLADAGRLSGLVGLRQKRSIRFKPYFVTRFRDDGEVGELNEGYSLDGGFDLYYKPTPSVTAVFTVNTDFAEAEVDDRVVNLTRFPTFFPEKRGFFLEDANVFSFGGISRNPLPYFSRRIGIGPGGQPTDIEYGVKVTGRLGNVNFGAFNTYVDAVGGVDAKHLSVLRASVGVLEESSVGFLATRGDPLSNLDNWLGGLDFKYRDSDFGPDGGELDVFAWGQYTDTPGWDDAPFALGTSALYNSRYWLYQGYTRFIGADYNPAMGFVNQTDIVDGELLGVHAFFPEGLDSIEVEAGSYYRYELDAAVWEVVQPWVGLSVYTLSGDFATVGVEYFYEELLFPFQPAPGLLAEPGQYSGAGLYAELETSDARVVSATVRAAVSPFYGGRLDTLEAGIAWRPASIFNLSAESELNRIEIDGLTEWVNLYRLKTNVQFSTDLVWTTIGQYDSLSRELGFNSRLRWTYRPGSDLFLIFNQGLLNDPRDGWISSGSELSLKVNASWSF